jgi:hypothetical protein
MQRAGLLIFYGGAAGLSLFLHRQQDLSVNSILVRAVQ